MGNPNLKVKGFDFLIFCKKNFKICGTEEVKNYEGSQSRVAILDNTLYIIIMKIKIFSLLCSRFKIVKYNYWVISYNL